MAADQPATAATVPSLPNTRCLPAVPRGLGHWNGHEYVPTIQSSVYVSHECYDNRHGDCAWTRCECGCHRDR